MKRDIFSAFLSLSFVVLFYPQHGAAQTASGTTAVGTTATPAAKTAERADNNETLKTGVISSYGRYIGGTSVDALPDDTSAGGDPSPIASSVQRAGSNACIVTVKNNSAKDSYRITFEVQNVGANGKVLGKRYFSSTLSAGKSEEKRVPCDPKGNMQVVLKSGKKL